MNDELAEIREEFILEAREHLAVLETALLSMEQTREETSTDAINTIFRAIHSLKGGFSFLAYESAKNLSHAMESVLMQARDGQIAVDATVAEVLLRSFDVLRVMLDDLDNSAAVRSDSVLLELQDLLNRKAPRREERNPDTDASGRESPLITPKADAEHDSRRVSPNLLDAATQLPASDECQELREPTAAEIRDAISFRNSMYRITLHTSEDAKVRAHEAARLVAAVNGIGTCLASKTISGNGEARIVVLCTSALDPAALQESLAISERAIKVIDLASGRAATVSESQARLEAVPVRERTQGRAGSFDIQTPVPPTFTGAALAEQRLRDMRGPDRVVQHESAPPSLMQTQLHTSLNTSGPASTSSDGRGVSAVKETLRVRVELLSRLMNVAGELVLGRNQLLRALKESADTVPGLVSILQHIDRVTTELQEGVMQTRMQPLSILFARQQRLVRDVSQQLGKPVRMEAQGGEVELDKSILEGLADPLIHIIRNCIDHGIESPAIRKRLSKPAQAVISIRAYHEGGQVNVEVADDGQGIDRAKLIAKAIEKRIISADAANELSEREAINLIFLPGFSTADTVSEVSGRGVGMDVVRTNIERLGGHVDIHTTTGVGTTVLLRLPLTLAIVPSLIVRVGPSRFAVPQANIVELVRIQANDGAHRIEKVHGAPVLRLRERLLSLIHLGDVLGIQSNDTSSSAKRCVEVAGTTQSCDANATSPSATGANDCGDECFVLVLRAGANKYGVIVDELQEWEEIVVKPAPTHLKGVACFAGTTILGDGCVIMILDTAGLATRAKLSFANIQREEHRRSMQLDTPSWSGAITYSVILFEGAPNEVYAVPQDRVLRLERIRVDSLLRIGRQQYVQYRGRGLPVFPLNQCFPVASVPDDSEELYLVIPRGQDGSSDAHASAGLLIWKILDALDVSLVLERPMFLGPGVLGCAVVQDKLTTFIDPTAMVNAQDLFGGAP